MKTDVHSKDFALARESENGPGFFTTNDVESEDKGERILLDSYLGQPAFVWFVCVHFWTEFQLGQVSMMSMFMGQR